MFKAKKNKNIHNQNSYINITLDDINNYNTFVNKQKKHSQQRPIYSSNKGPSSAAKYGTNTVLNFFFWPPQKYTNLQLSLMMRYISPHNRANSPRPLLFINSYHLGPQFRLGKNYKLLSVTSQAEAESIVLMLQELGYLPQNAVIYRNDLMLAKCHAQNKLLDVQALYQIPLKVSVIQTLAKNYGPMWMQTLQQQHKKHQGKNNNTHKHVNTMLDMPPKPQHNHSNTINPINPVWPNSNPDNAGIPPAYHNIPLDDKDAPSAPPHPDDEDQDNNNIHNDAPPPPYAPWSNANGDNGQKQQPSNNPFSSPMPNPYNTINHSEDIENDDGRPEGAPMGNTFDPDHPDNVNNNIPYNYLNGGYLDNNTSCGKASGYQNIFANPNMIGDPTVHQPGAPAPLPQYKNAICTPG